MRLATCLQDKADQVLVINTLPPHATLSTTAGLNTAHFVEAIAKCVCNFKVNAHTIDINVLESYA